MTSSESFIASTGGLAHRSPVAIVRHTDRGLQLPDRIRNATVDREIEDLKRDGRVQLVGRNRVPEVMAIDRDRTVSREVLDVDVRVKALRDGPSSFRRPDQTGLFE